MNWKRRMWGYVSSGIVFYSAVVGLMYAGQRYLMYFPSKEISAPETYNLADMQDVKVLSADGAHIQLWVHPAANGKPTFLYFHGNAGNLAHRASEFRLWIDAGFGVVALSYPGYGKSEGSPSEEGIYQAARAAVKYAQEELHVPLSSLVLYGESLGTGVAVQMGTEYKVGAVILEAPYTATSDRAAELYPYLPVSLIMKDQFRSKDKIAKLHAPIQIFHGEKDTVIPIAHGKALFALANEPKEAVYYPNVSHVDFDLPEQLIRMRAFLQKHGVMK